jgi:sigma-B regulation protein RsbU (phosphoserine phosphatase)
LNSGDVLVFYSDGLTEAMNRNEEQFGEDRLVATLEGVDGLDAAAVRERILARVSTFLDGVPPQDDMTIVVVRVN